jgi:hypothetical protein
VKRPPGHYTRPCAAGHGASCEAGTTANGRDYDEPALKQALVAAERSRIAEYRRAADDAVKAYFSSKS